MAPWEYTDSPTACVPLKVEALIVTGEMPPILESWAPKPLYDELPLAAQVSLAQRDAALSRHVQAAFVDVMSFPEKAPPATVTLPVEGFVQS